MPVHNADVAAIFNEIADLLELEEANPFRVRAYRSAVRVVGDLSGDVVTMVKDGEDLTELAGVGEDLAERIREIVTTGRSKMLSDLDLPDEVLSQLDIVVGAVHSRFNLSRERQTARILKAMDHPHFHILANPTGRLLLKREPYDVDMEQILRHARKRCCFLEVNAHPERLDLTDLACRMARDAGVLVSINSDAHTIHDFNNRRFGVDQARRGWLEKADILNARPLRNLRTLLSRTIEVNP